MQAHGIGVVAMSSDPAASSAWLVEHFGFVRNVDIGWYVDLQHPGHPAVYLDLIRLGHESMPPRLRDRAGGFLALLVEDVDAEERRLRAAGVEFVKPVTTEPWGQRRFQVEGPDSLVVEVLQQVEPDPQWLADQGITPSAG
ncbi:VOC family protein [Halostreptopolyspora alba]|uniref:VOC domain-containing protein n=1 Tax=Halostreptopolyspora alba TaxID=2487137 RepID=A0A3N0ECZ1_9ACTN|nr:hypothetical protein EFW17_07060 [Nocardiopsaceae bacterium YIM 96095]